MSMISRIDEAVFGRKAQPRGIVRGPTRPPHYPSPIIDSTPRTSVSRPVDVEAVLFKLATDNIEKLNWRESIVDLMKLFGLKSTVSARSELANELGYEGDGNDCAVMDLWLHKAIMKHLAMKGAKVPPSLWDAKAKTADKDASITNQAV